LVGKALGAGLPMSAMVARAEILNDLGPGMSSNTYAGYALGCAVTNRVLEIYDEDDLLQRCKTTGEYMAGVLREHKAMHPMVGDYSQIGVFLGIEYVRDDKKTPATTETIDLCDGLMEAGLLAQRNGYYGNRMSFLSPITISTRDVDEMFAILDKVTTMIERKYKLIG